MHLTQGDGEHGQIGSAAGAYLGEQIPTVRDRGAMLIEPRLDAFRCALDVLGG